MRYPPAWIVEQGNPETVVIKDPNGQAQLTINFLSTDCDSVQATLRGGPHFNYHLVREFQKQVAQRDVSAHEFLDTMGGARETRVLLPAKEGCVELRQRHLETPESQGGESTLEVMLSTFEFFSESQPGPA